MALSIRLTSAMTAAEMAPYWSRIVECLQRYVRRFPHYETVNNILQQCASGRRQLWIVTDETDAVALVLITEIVQLEATGHKRLILYELAGKRALEAQHLLPEVEKWAAKTHGVTEAEVLGRKGWAKFAEDAGYRPKAIIFRKRIGHDA